MKPVKLEAEYTKVEASTYRRRVISMISRIIYMLKKIEVVLSITFFGMSAKITLRVPT